MNKTQASDTRDFYWGRGHIQSHPKSNQTPQSEANLAMAKERLKLDLRACGTPFGRSGGRFLTQRQMNHVRHAESVINSQVNRKLRKSRPLNDGDAYSIIRAQDL